MANVRAMAMYDYLLNNGIESAQLLGENEEVICINWELENCKLTAYIDYDENEKTAHYEVVNYIQVPKSRVENINLVLNEFNNEYRWVKFIYNEKEDEINVRMDIILPQDADEACEIANEGMVRVISIADEAYEELMEALWAKMNATSLS